MKRYLLTAGLIFCLVGCGQADSTAQDDQSAEIPEASSPQIDPALISLWSGTYDIFDPKTDKFIARLEFTEERGRWNGQISLTEDFCQTDFPQFPTYCPFEGALLSLGPTDANIVSLVTSGLDRFREEMEKTFTVVMTSTDQETIANIVLQADGGRFSIDGKFEKIE